MINKNYYLDIKTKLLNGDITDEDFNNLIKELKEINILKDLIELINKKVKEINEAIKQKEDAFNEKMDNLIIKTNEKNGEFDTRL